MRYLATAFIVNKRRRPQFKDFIKVIQQEQHSYKDPITEFLACVYVNYDFDGAQRKMKECEEVCSLYFWLENMLHWFVLVDVFIYCVGEHLLVFVYFDMKMLAHGDCGRWWLRFVNLHILCVFVRM